MDTSDLIASKSCFVCRILCEGLLASLEHERTLTKRSPLSPSEEIIVMWQVDQCSRDDKDTLNGVASEYLLEPIGDSSEFALYVVSNSTVENADG